MKKLFLVILIALLAMSLFAGGAKEEEKSAETENKAQNASAINEFQSSGLKATDANIIRGGKLVLGTTNEVSMSYAPWKSRGASMSSF